MLLNRTSFLCIALAGLAGCAGMSEQACVSADWRTIGFEDGTLGRSEAAIGGYRKQCGDHGVTPDLDAYRAGHADGVLTYCRANHGFDVGHSGAAYQGVCPANMEADFLSEYNAGRHLFELESALRNIDARIAGNYRAQENIKKELTQLTLGESVSIGGDLKPQIPASGAELASGTAPRALDQAVGWISATDVNGNGKIDQEEVKTVPRSLLQKSLVAQAVFDNKFLLPFAPEPPAFFLVPGDNQVTVVWEPSPSEQTGDPYYAVAGAPTVPGPGGAQVANPLFDPDFRQFDVEGYRVYRGRTSGNLTLVRQ